MRTSVSPILAFFLGFFFVIFIIALTYLIAQASQPVSEIYARVLCPQNTSPSSST